MAGPSAGLSRQALWLLSAKLVGFACNLALPVLLARSLSPYDYGLFKQSFLVVTTLLGVLPLGMSMSAFYYLARDTARRGQTVFHILLFHGAMGLAAGAVLALFPGFWRLLFPSSPELAARGGMIGLIVWTGMIATLLESLATANRDVKRSSAFIAGAQALKTSLLVAAALWRPDIDTLLAAGLLHAAAEALVLLWYLRHAFPGYWREFDPAFLREQLSYALPLGGAGILYIFQTDLPNYFVSWLHGPAAFAVYANGNFQIPLIGLVRDSLSALLIGRMSSLEAQNRGPEIAALNDAVTRRLMLLYFPATAFFFYQAEDLILLIYGDQYAASVSIFRVALLSFPLQAFLLDPVLRAYAGHRYFLLRLRVASLCLLTLALFSLGREAPLAFVMGIVVAMQSAERLAILRKVRGILGRKSWLPWRPLLELGILALAPLVPMALLESFWPLLPRAVRLGLDASLYGALFLAAGWFSGRIRSEDLPWKRELS